MKIYNTTGPKNGDGKREWPPRVDTDINPSGHFKYFYVYSAKMDL